MPSFVLPFMVIHMGAVFAKLTVFFAIPRLKSVEDVKRFLKRFRPYERISDWILWITGGALIYFTSWEMLKQAWMIISLLLYLLVFLLMRFALTREMEKISESKKLLATSELQKLRTSNWCVAVIAIVLLGVIAYLMTVKP